MTKETKESIICLLAGGLMGLLFMYWILAPLIQF